MAASPSARSARTAHDNARARRLGYKDYYDYRLHDNGKIPASKPLPPRGQRGEQRGHAGGLRKFLKELKPGDIIVMPDGLAAVDLDKQDRFREVRKLVLKEDGRAPVYVLKRLTYDRMVRLIEQEEERGATWSPSPSLDQRRLVNRPDRAGEDETATARDVRERETRRN